MSGHSHWATIKHKKGAIDAKRGKLWSKLSRAIIIAARHGGGDPTMNLKLRYAIDKARAGQHAQGQHRARHQARHRRGRGHDLRGDHLRRLSAPAASPSWSTSSPTTAIAPPARSARSSSAAAARWAAPAASPILFERKGLFSVDAARRRRGHADGHRPGRRRRRPEARGRHLRDHLRSGALQPGAGSAAKEQHRRPSLPRSASCPRPPSMPTWRRRRRCCVCSKRSTITTTCRTSIPT